VTLLFLAGPFVAGCSAAPAPVAVVEATNLPAATAEPTPTSTLVASPRLLPGDPSPALTPGGTNPAVTQANIHSTICVSGWTATVRPPVSYTNPLKVEQLNEYGYTDTNLADYEEDHLISLEIGGAPRDPRNLWPEPYAVGLSDGRAVGARVKDQYENRLHELVCSGQMRLATAQADIAHDWISHWFALTGQAPPPSGTAPFPTIVPAPTATNPPPTTAPAGGTIFVRITKLTSPVSRGHDATAIASTVAGASCGIEVVYKSGPSTASGLGDKTASSTGSVSWTWRVGTRTTVGTWPVTVTCSVGDASASATKSFRVR
jgi:hypothetical protein